MLYQLIIGFVFTALIAIVALWRGSLSTSGAITAAIVGTLTFGLGGWPWGVLLALFFVSSSLLSHFKEGEKRLAAEKFDKGHKRDSGQVLANGTIGAALATASVFLVSDIWLPAFVGAMATVTADTWATELGTLSKRPPRLITNGQTVEVGTSGGVSSLGFTVSFSGGLLIGLAASVMTGESLFSLALIGAVSGLIGSIFDSLLGATVQQIYYCEYCQKETESKKHKCGHDTRPMRGWSWLNNDLVNLSASVVGSITAVGLWQLVS